MSRRELVRRSAARSGGAALPRSGCPARARRRRRRSLARSLSRGRRQVPHDAGRSDTLDASTRSHRSASRGAIRFGRRRCRVPPGGSSVAGAHLDDPTAYISDPRIALRRNEAQARLEAVVANDRLRSRRSRAAGLLGVLGLARFVTETENREALLSSTVLNFRRAIDLDPSNDEAKVNLELAYQRGRGVQINESASGENPSPGGSGSRGAGAGQAGSGY